MFMTSLMALESEAATYFTKKTGSDGNSCAQAQNENTPKLTIMAGSMCLTTPGDTLVVGDGTYVENEIDLRVSGTAANPITIRAQNPLQAILSSTSGGSCGPNIGFYASYLVVDGIHSQIDPSDPACPSITSAMGFVRMWNTNDPAVGGNTSTGYVGGVVRNCLVDWHPHRIIGIKSDQDNSVIENCVVHASLGIFNGVNQIIRNNYVDTGDYWGDLLTSKGGVRSAQIYNNTIHMTGAQRGLTIGGNSSCCWWDSGTHYEAYNVAAYNNVVLVDSGAAGAEAAIGMVGAINSAFYNNVIIGGGVFLVPGSQSGYAPQPLPYNPALINNIFSCGGLPYSQYYGYAGTPTIDYNDFYNCSGAPGQTHGVVGDPRFVNPASDWHLQAGSPALGSGFQASFAAYDGGVIDVSKDKVGAARTVPWSLGIYSGNASAAIIPPSKPGGLLLR